MLFASAQRGPVFATGVFGMLPSALGDGQRKPFQAKRPLIVLRHATNPEVHRSTNLLIDPSFVPFRNFELGWREQWAGRLRSKTNLSTSRQTGNTRYGVIPGNTRTEKIATIPTHNGCRLLHRTGTHA